MPIRCWRKITLGPRLARTRSAISARIGAATVINKTDKNLSRRGFQVRTYAPCRLAVVLACGGPRLPTPTAVMPYSSPLDVMFFTSRHEPHFSSPPMYSACSGRLGGHAVRRACSPSVFGFVMLLVPAAARSLSLIKRVNNQSMASLGWLPGSLARGACTYEHQAGSGDTAPRLLAVVIGQVRAPAEEADTQGRLGDDHVVARTSQSCWARWYASTVPTSRK